MHNYEGLQFTEVKKIICKYCSFSLGEKLIEDQQPSFSKLEVQRNNERIKEALALTVSYGQMPFGGIYDISEQINYALKDGTLTAGDLLKVSSQCYAVGQIKKYIEDAKGEYPSIKDLTDSLTAYPATAQRIDACISHSGEIYDKASNELYNIRRKIKTLEKTIAAKMGEYVQKNANYLQDTIIATRNDRSVVLVKNTFKNTVSGLQYGSSASGGATYVEPSEMIPLNNDLQNAIASEQEEIRRILFNLSQMVKNDGYGYLANVETLGILDALFAKAMFGKMYDGIAGDISETDLILEKARHPLIDRSKVVANSYHIIDPIKTILITGANTGGKTVSLKVIALSSLMFLCGIPVLADKAEIPVFDHIFYDIGDNQSIDDDLSTFSAHIKNISFICRKATKKSLVIIDELGSATDPNEGQAIASAVLDHLRKKEVYVVATTHFSKLKAYGKQHNDILISAVEFDQENLQPTYRYLENSVGQSNAIEIARRYGISKEIIDSAYRFKKAQQTDSDALLETLQTELETVRQNKEKVEAEKAEVENIKQQLLQQQEKLKEDREVILAKAKDDAAVIIEDARSESEKLINDLKQIKNYDINKVAQIKKKLDNLDDYQEDEDIDDTDFKIGDYVRITLTNQKGTITDLRKKEAVIDCNGVTVRSSIGSIVKTTKPVEKKVESRAKVTRTSSFSIELNLIGMRVLDAMEVLDKYLDDAVVNRAPYVRIVHGMGTGALRKAVWDKLAKCKYVAKYEFASSGEGSTGATIVTFKE